MTEMTQAEVSRAIQRLETGQRSFVSKDVYERDLKELRGDLNEIKESQKWAMRLLVSNFLGLIVAVVIFLATRGIG